MRHKLRINGKAFDVLQLCFDGEGVSSAGVRIDGTYQVVYRNSDSDYVPEGSLTADFSKDLITIGQYDDLANDLEKWVHNNNEELVKLAVEYIENDKLPFADEGRLKRYKALQERTKGLLDALDLTKEYMNEDVDLSGSETPTVNFAGEVYVKE